MPKNHRVKFPLLCTKITLGAAKVFLFVVSRMASSRLENQVVDPDYIKYLLNPKQEYDWYFVVGNGKNKTPVVSRQCSGYNILGFIGNC